MDRLIPLHKQIIKSNITNFGLKYNKNDLSEFFDSQAENSKIYLDYNLFDNKEDDYLSDHIT